MAETKKQEVAVKQEMNTRLSFYANQYTGLMERDFAEHVLPLMIIPNSALWHL